MHMLPRRIFTDGLHGKSSQFLLREEQLHRTIWTKVSQLGKLREAVSQGIPTLNLQAARIASLPSQLRAGTPSSFKVRTAVKDPRMTPSINEQINHEFDRDALNYYELVVRCYF